MDRESLAATRDWRTKDDSRHISVVREVAVVLLSPSFTYENPISIEVVLANLQPTGG